MFRQFLVILLPQARPGEFMAAQQAPEGAVRARPPRMSMGNLPTPPAQDRLVSVVLISPVGPAPRPLVRCCLPVSLSSIVPFRHHLTPVPLSWAYSEDGAGGRC